jgi:formylglycine-generating enzyme required for sulfatase activity
VYGVYDMSGGANEYTAAYINNSNADDYFSNIATVKAKYKDNYTGYNNNKKGEAVYETSSSSSGSNSWYSDYSYMPSSSNPWFRRGGIYSNGSSAGVFYFYYSGGYANLIYGWRVVALVGEGL